jgi:hypothetical protein
LRSLETSSGLTVGFFDPEEQEAFDELLSIARGEVSVEEVERWIVRNLSRAKEEK